MEDQIEEEQAGVDVTDLINTFKERAGQYRSQFKEITPQNLQRMRKTVTSISQGLPEATLVGGVALRVQLDQRGLPVPEFFGADYDYSVPKEEFKEVTQRLLKTPLNDEGAQALQAQYRVKGTRENTPWGEHNFLQDPDNYIALEDSRTTSHIDLFVQRKPQDDETIEYYGRQVRVVSPEQLFIQSARELRKQLQERSVQFRRALYFNLAGSLVDEEKMDKVWKGYIEKGQVSPTQNWREIIVEINNELEKAEKERRIIQEVIH